MGCALSVVSLGFRNLILPTAALLLSLAATKHFPLIWQPLSGFLPQLPLWLFAIVFILAAQFNRSRIAILSLFLALFYAALQHLILSADVMARFSDLIFLGGIFFISALMFIEDRALLSVYGLNRIGLAVICLIGSSLWLWAVRLWVQPTVSNIFSTQILPPTLITLDVLCVILVFIQIVRTLSIPSTTHATLFFATVVWLIWHYFPHIAIAPVLFSLTGFFLLLAVLADSYWLAYRDELTGLPSRRALNQLALSLGNRYSVAMLDVDHFKKFNDKHGHDVGDQVLKLVAMQLRKVKGGGKYFRYGGEEFTIVFPRKNTDGAIPFLEEVRRSIAGYKMVLREGARKTNTEKNRHRAKPSRHQSVSVTISIGVAEKLPGKTFEQTIKAADEALYRAKEQGRNRVCQ